MKKRNRELVSARAVNAILVAARVAGVRFDTEQFVSSVVHGHDDELIPISRLFACSRALLSVEREDVGLAIGQHMPLEATGLWGFLLRSSTTYGEMLRRGAKYIRIVNKFPEYEIQSCGAHVALVSSHPAISPLGPRHHVVTSMMSHWIAWGRQLTGVDFPVVDAHVSGPVPADTSPWMRFFQGRVTFGTQDDIYLIDAEVLDLPLRESAPELSEEFEHLAELLLTRLDGSPSFHDRVERALNEELLAGSATAEHVARRLATTPRTMHRRLAEEGLTYRDLKEQLLRARAETLLRGSDATLQEVSFLLGFAEPPNFSRAFRRWTGMAPGAWRERVNNEPSHV